MPGPYTFANGYYSSNAEMLQDPFGGYSDADLQRLIGYKGVQEEIAKRQNFLQQQKTQQEKFNATSPVENSMDLSDVKSQFYLNGQQINARTNVNKKRAEQREDNLLNGLINILPGARSKYDSGFTKVSNNAVGNLADHSINTSMNNIKNATLNHNFINPNLVKTPNLTSGSKLLNNNLSLSQNSGQGFSAFTQNNGFNGTNQLGANELAQNIADKKITDAVSSGKSGGFGNFMNEHAGAISAGLNIGAEIGDHFLNKSFSDLQAAQVSGAWGRNNEIEDAANNTNATIASTNFYDANNQMKNKLNQINQYKTKELSTGQIGGMAGIGAAKGAAMGTQILPGWGTAIGAVVGGAVGLGKGLLANNKISDANVALQQKATEVNNYMNRSMMDIKSQQMNRAKQDIFNNSFLHTRANGGYLYANGGLMNPYGINVFNTGGKHSQNAFGGVPVSIAEDGKPNLVEEGEVLYDDYVYSNRIKINDTIRRRLKLKDSTKTFADAAKEVKERGDDRPNDPVTEKTIKAQMQFLKSEQDKKKEQQEEKEQQKMLAQMNEQQLQAMQEQQMNEEANAYEQQMAEEQMAQQAPQEQMANPQMQEQMIAQQQQPQQQMFAKGGNLKGGSNDADAHRFDGRRVSKDLTRKKDKDTLSKDRKELIKKYIQDIESNNDLSDNQKKEAIGELFNTINRYQDNHYSVSNEIGDNWNIENEKVRELQNFWNGFNDSNNNIIGNNFDIDGIGTTNDRAKTWTDDGIFGNQTRIGRTWGTEDYGFSDEELKEINELAEKYGYNYSLNDNGYYKFNPIESPTEKTYRDGEDVLPNYNWRYKQTPVPGLIDTYLAARAFEPADYSRANSIINTPIRDIQYTPNGGKIAPYIIDPRLQYQMNADLGAATNRGLVNNAGGNSAAAQAALLANNRQISQSAANLGYQADERNAAQIQGATQYNSGINRADAQGFLSAAEANQRADVQRGEFNYYGQNMKENIDAQRGQAISNSLQSLSDDYMNYYKDRYNQGMMAGLVDSGYFGEPTPFLRQQAGWNPNGTFTTKNYLLDDYGNKHYIVNNSDGTVDFENPNNDLMKENKGKKLMFNNTNGQYYFG